MEIYLHFLILFHIINHIYITNMIKKKKFQISIMQLYFLAPIGIFIHRLFPSIMGIIDKKLGIRILTIFTTISLYISHIIIYFSIEYYLLIISYIFLVLH